MASPKISKKVLTVKGVENAKPDPKSRQEIPDAGLPGFYLIIQPSGAKSFALRYRVGGKSRKWTIADVRKISLEEARRLAREAIGKIARGEDPAAQKAASRRPGAASGVPQTIDELVEVFLARYVRRKCRASTANAYEGSLRRDVLPRWKGRAIGSIRRADVRALLEEIAEDRPVLANRTLATISKMFAWAASEELLEASPAVGVEKPTEEESRERVLSDAELRLVLDAADELRTPVEKQYMRMLLLTLQRRCEVAGMKWTEVDLAGRMWTLPAARTKNKREHRVPLSDAAMVILDARPKDATYVFPNTRGTGPFARFGPIKSELDRLITKANSGTPIEPWTLQQDVRRSGASVMPRLGVNLATIEKLVNHASGSFRGIVSVYQKYDYEAEIRMAMERWAMHLAAIRADNVISLRRA